MTEVTSRLEQAAGVFTYQPELVTEVSPREPRYTGGISAPVIFGGLPEGTKEAWQQAQGQEKYTFPNMGTYDDAMRTIHKILTDDPNDITSALSLLAEKTIPGPNERSELGKWTHAALQLPGDWGPENKYRADMRQRLTDRSQGVVLEAMCGFDTYIDDSPEITEVIALDFCREALELYQKPERQRVLFDLNSVGENGGIDFLNSESINTICITFGVDYLDDLPAVYREFWRVLAPGGNFLIVGGDACGYGDLLRQYFNVDHHRPLLEDAGFVVAVEDLQYNHHHRPGMGEFYLIEASKPGG